MISAQTIEKILSLYDLRPRTFLEQKKGYRNISQAFVTEDGTIFNLMLFKQEPLIKDQIISTDKFTSYLSENGLPVRRAIDKRIVQISSPAGIRLARLYNYLPGQTISWEAYTQKHIKLLGSMMAEMHKLAADYAGDSVPLVHETAIANATTMQRYFSDSNVVKAMAKKLNLSIPFDRIKTFITVLSSAPAWGTQLPLHMDFVRSNILFDQDSTEDLHISGIIDFEKAAYGPPVFDLARTLAFLIVDCKYKDAAKVRKYFLHSGYKKRGGADLQLKALRVGDVRQLNIEWLISFYLLYDFYKFLRHNPYESLFQNEHYVRTVAVLLDRAVLESA